MAILPIDIQTILGQMNNAGRMQHNVEHSPGNQQQHQGNVIHKQAEEKNRQVSDLEQTDTEDKKVNPDKDKKQEFSNQKENDQKDKSTKTKEGRSVLSRDPDKGNLIDIKK